jgi:hypothetical protein
MKTLNELERDAYMAGNTPLAAGFAAIDDLDNVLNDADLTLDRTIETQIEEKLDKAVNDNCPDHAAYKQFFEDCFKRLNGYYPCASPTSDYDCSVIFNAIERGERTTK